LFGKIKVKQNTFYKGKEKTKSSYTKNKKNSNMKVKEAPGRRKKKHWKITSGKNYQ